jgi:hypothetical protein
VLISLIESFYSVYMYQNIIFQLKIDENVSLNMRIKKHYYSQCYNSGLIMTQSFILLNLVSILFLRHGTAKRKAITELLLGL